MTIKDQFSIFLVDVWSRINKIEEHALATGLESDVSVTEINIIAKIAENPCIRMSDAARIVGVTLATLTVACDKLESKGLLERSRDRNDRRVVNVSLTPKGMAAYAFHRQFHEQIFSAVLGELTTEEEAVLGRCLEKLQNVINTLPDAL